MDYKVKIIIATHKKYEMPSDSMYIPVHVGAEGKVDSKGNELDFGYVKDNFGENISSLNSSFCELTGLYWGWKNLEYDYLGLVHYRRHFSMKGKNGFKNILSYNDLIPYLGEIKVFTPKKRKYFIESLYSHYAHTHYAEHLDQTREIIKMKYPDYLPYFDAVLKQTSGYMFNMMIMEKELINDYCMWLFDILFELQEKIDTSKLDCFQARLYGRVSEILFNVWIEEKIYTGKLNRCELMEIPNIHLENINWIKKGSAFLKAKFFSKKYKGSF
ncbi:DUF4422 domain-containing protein [Enterococcus cecorum]|uniref:DUF4422 domain-containing protein n=1 Tax=Enterococcus cecorum TaxID=44008 RepID=UPI00148C2DBD|nr:DUF4422 domain-containing protein [Enterococcus cecorum]